MISRNGTRQAIRSIGGLWLVVWLVLAGPVGCTSGDDGEKEDQVGQNRAEDADLAAGLEETDRTGQADQNDLVPTGESDVNDGADVLELTDPPDPFLEQAQQWVDDCRALYKDLEVPDSLMQEMNGLPTKTADAFDPNLFFSVLDRLQMEEGWVLDYTYFYAWDVGGEPTLVARDASSPLCLSDPENPCVFEAVEPHLFAEPTKEGLTQVLIFRTMGNQFYQHWHPHTDFRLVFTGAGLERWKKETRDGLFPEATEDFEPQAASLQVNAAVVLNTDSLHVKAARVGCNSAPGSLSVLISSEPPYEFSAGPDPSGEMCECTWCVTY